MLNPPPRTVYLKDYTPPAFLVYSVDLDVDIREAFTRVHATLRVKRKPRRWSWTGTSSISNGSRWTVAAWIAAHSRWMPNA